MNNKRIEEILGSSLIDGDGAKIAAIRKAIGMPPRFEDIPDGTPAIIRVSDQSEVVAVKRDNGWQYAFRGLLAWSKADSEIVSILVPDPGDVDQQIEHEAERLTAKWQAKYEKQRMHSEGLESALRDRNIQIASLEVERSRLNDQIARMEARF